MAKRNYHVVPRKDEGKWAVIGENKGKAESLHDTQREAIERGRKLAIDNQSELVIHGRNGKIRDKDSYGNDPFPPKDKKH
ncbi:MAG TPA: DUF2188 domain-containing protein [Thermodesulfobacteriota bacterium]|nr:DUF2188 domain-containing protein [Thermodesulfobacteriota bacterium]